MIIILVSVVLFKSFTCFNWSSLQCGQVRWTRIADRSSDSRIFAETPESVFATFRVSLRHPRSERAEVSKYFPLRISVFLAPSALFSVLSHEQFHPVSHIATRKSAIEGAPGSGRHERGRDGNNYH